MVEKLGMQADAYTQDAPAHYCPDGRLYLRLIHHYEYLGRA